jgi:hypothetical protein
VSTEPHIPAIAAALLDAHVRFYVDQMTGESLSSLVDATLDQALERADCITLGAAVSRDAVKATARTYAVELTLKGAIPEIAGEIARALHAHPIHDRIRLEELVSDRRIEDLLDHALEFKSLRGKLVLALIASPLYETFASELLYNGIKGYLSRASLGGIPGGRSAMELGKAVVGRAGAGLEASFEQSLKGYIARTARAISEQSIRPLIDGEHDEAVRELLLDSWQRFRGTILGTLRDDVSAEDLEELFVTGYELWQELRRTELIGSMIDSGIDTLFDRYAEVTLLELLEEIGITREIMRTEAMRFAPTAIGALHGEGLLEPMVRSWLEPFYRSGAVADILGARLVEA